MIAETRSSKSNTTIKLCFDSYWDISCFSQKGRRLLFQTEEGITIINIEDIISIEEKLHQTFLNLKKGRRIIVLSTINIYEQQLKHFGFIKVHHAHLINTDHLFQYKEKKGGQIQMRDNSIVPVEKDKKKALLTLLRNL